MRPSLIAGLLVMVIGAFLFLRGESGQATHLMVRVGDMHMTDTNPHAVPTWVGGLVIVAGIGVVASGAMKWS